MSFWSYNRRLVWVVVPCVIWGLISVSFALGLGPGGDGAGFQVGAAGEGIRINGVLRSAREDGERLVLTVAVPPGKPGILLGRDGQELPHPPPGLEVEFVEQTTHRRRPVELNLSGQTEKPRRLPGGHYVFASKGFVVRYDNAAVMVTPRPLEDMPGGGFVKDKLKERLHERHRPPPAGD